MQQRMKTTVGTKGIVERRLYSREKFFSQLVLTGVPVTSDLSFTDLYDEALKYLPKQAVDTMLDQSAKEMFKDNFLWKYLKKNFDLDLVIPFVTGYYTKKAIRANLVTTRGKQVVAERIGGTGSQGAITAIAIGVGVTAAAAGDTALGSESTTNGGARGAATVTNVTTTTTNDTEQWVKTFSFTGSLAVTEEGLFDNNTSGGNMLARQVFSAVNVVNGDSLQITHKVQAT